MITTPRPLAGLRFGLSISAPAELPGGADPEQAVNSLTVNFASSILLEGGGLLLGHRWQPDGILEYLAFHACDSRWAGGAHSATQTQDTAPPILNLLAWPDQPPATDHNARKMIEDGILVSRQIPPPGIPLHRLDADPNKALDSDLGKLARVRALTALRQAMAAQADARICLGGAAGKPLRRLPGVIEEALFTHQAGKPLFIAGALGGAAKAMADAILRRRMEPSAQALFYTPPESAALYAQFADEYPAPHGEGPSHPEGWNVLEQFASLEIPALARQAGLTEEEYLQVLTSTEVPQVLRLAITGVLRRRAAEAAQG